MSRLTFAQAKARIKHHLPDRDDTSILDALNLGIQEIALHFPVQDRGTFTTLPKLSGGTVSVTQGSTAVVGTGTAFASGYEGGLIRIEGDDTWFGVPTVTDTENIVLSSAWAQTSDATATYEIVQPFVTLPAAVMRLVKVWIADYEELRPAGDEREHFWSETLTAQPMSWADAPYGSSGERKIQLSPFPDERYACTYTYHAEPTLYTSSDSSETSLPAFLNPLVIAAGLWMVWDQEDAQDRSAYWMGRFKDLLKRARAERMAGKFYQAEGLVESRRWLRESRPVGG